MKDLTQKMYSADFVLHEGYTTESIKCFERKELINEKGHYVLYIEQGQSDNLVEQIESQRKLLVNELKNSNIFRRWFGLICIYVFIEANPNESIVKMKEEMYKCTTYFSTSGLSVIFNTIYPLRRVVVTFLTCTNGNTIEEVKFGLMKPRMVEQVLNNLRN